MWEAQPARRSWLRAQVREALDGHYGHGDALACHKKARPMVAFRTTRATPPTSPRAAPAHRQLGSADLSRRVKQPMFGRLVRRGGVRMPNRADSRPGMTNSDACQVRLVERNRSTVERAHLITWGWRYSSSLPWGFGPSGSQRIDYCRFGSLPGGQFRAWGSVKWPLDGCSLRSKSWLRPQR